MKRVYNYTVRASQRPELQGFQNPALSVGYGNPAWHTMHREDYILRARREEYLAGETEVDTDFFLEVLSLAGDKPEYAEMRECALGFLAAMQVIEQQSTPEVSPASVAEPVTPKVLSAPSQELRAAS